VTEQDVIRQAAWLNSLPDRDRYVLANRFREHLATLGADEQTFETFDVRGVEFRAIKTSAAVIRWMKTVTADNQQAIEWLGRLFLTTLPPLSHAPNHE
jgi:hypothetical protein